MRQTTNLPGVRDNLKDLLQLNLVADQSALPITQGQDLITVEYTCPFQDGDTILIYAPETNSEAFTRQVIVKPDSQLFLSAPIPADMPTARIQRVIGDTTLKGIYTGDPQPKAYPAITISGDVDTQPYALGGTDLATYSIIFACYAQATTYDEANRVAWAYAQEIERILTYRPAMQKQTIPRLQEDHLTNDNSTLKVVHLLYVMEELIQRYAVEMPVNLQM